MCENLEREKKPSLFLTKARYSISFTIACLSITFSVSFCLSIWGDRYIIKAYYYMFRLAKSSAGTQIFLIPLVRGENVYKDWWKHFKLVLYIDNKWVDTFKRVLLGLDNWMKELEYVMVREWLFLDFFRVSDLSEKSRVWRTWLSLSFLLHKIREVPQILIWISSRCEAELRVQQ